MEIRYFSNQWTSMNSFLSRLGLALEHLPDNPSPGIEGFYLAYYNPKKGTIVGERIGSIPDEKKDFTQMHYSCYGVTQTYLFGIGSSLYFRKKSYGDNFGMFSMKTDFGVFSAGVTAFYAEVGEAVAALWIIAKKIMNEMGVGAEYATTPDFFHQIFVEAEAIQREFMPDNQYIVPLAELMEIYV